MNEKNNKIETIPPRGKLITAGTIFICGFLEQQEAH